MDFSMLAVLGIWTICLLQANLVFSQEAPPDYAEDVFRECNTTIRQGDGVIISPNFTATYPNNLHCWWTIIVEPDRIVTLTFGHFDIEGGMNCQYDRVSVYNGPTSDHPQLGRFCGAFRPGQQVSTSNKMHIRMDTDGSSGRSGFYAVISSTTPIVATEGSCGGLLIGSEGSFHSPNYPDSDYPPGVSCSWNIRAEEGQVIRLTFKDFDIEKSSGCKYDALTMFTSWTYSAKTKNMGRFCSGIENLPSAIVSQGNELFVTFTSDASGFGRGFVAHYATESERQRGGEPRAELAQPLPSTTTTTTTTTTTLLTPTLSALTSFSCPGRCPKKIKLKTATCKSTYIVAIQVTNTRVLTSDSGATVQIIKAFKLGSMPSSSVMNAKLMCHSCFKMTRAGSYLVAGSTVTPYGIEIRPGDFVAKYKNRKHTKQAAKFIKRCKARGKPRRGGRKRAAAKRKRESPPTH